jgi:hypothetical protein
MNIKNVVLGIAIIILTISVAVYGISLFYDAPEHADYCGEFKTLGNIDTSQECEELGGYWDVEGPRSIDGEEQGYCDKNYYCGLEYDDAYEIYSKKVFMIAVPLGIIVILLGAVVFGLEAVGAGLMGGGVGIVLYGVGGFWRFAEDWLKFAMSLIGLVVLIWFAYRFNGKGFNWQKKKGKGKFKKRRKKKKK